MADAKFRQKLVHDWRDACGSEPTTVGLHAPRTFVPVTNGWVDNWATY